MSAASDSHLKFSRRIPALMLAIGLTALGLVVLIRMAPPPHSLSRTAALAALGMGLCWLVLALMQRTGTLWSFFRLINNNALVFIALIAMVEVGGRAAHFDFTKVGGRSMSEARDAYPVCAREPDRPLPEVYFHHPGPVAWQGQPLRMLEKLRKGTDNAYVNEPVISVSYDHDGFRNAPDLRDWEVAIIGDSYTEQGYLPIEQVTSSIVAKTSGLRVKNVGACDTGMWTYVRYLERFGHAASTRTAVFVMFEGNDVQDTTQEFEELQTFRQTGERPYRESGPETSFLQATAKTLKAWRHRPEEQSYQNAWFLHEGSDPLPFTISTELPVDPLKATSVQLQAVREALHQMSVEARKLKLDVVLAYVPVNNRVYHGMVKFAGSLPDDVRRWEPNKLPEFIANLCRENGIAFVDTTPSLREAAARGQFVHNRILDCHVNAEGARIMGDVIAEALKATVKPARLASQGL